MSHPPGLADPVWTGGPVGWPHCLSPSEAWGAQPDPKCQGPTPHPASVPLCPSSQAVEKLVQGAESGCHSEKEKQIVLNCSRLLTRVLPYIFEDPDWRGFFWSTVPGAGRGAVCGPGRGWAGGGVVVTGKEPLQGQPHSSRPLLGFGKGRCRGSAGATEEGGQLFLPEPSVSLPWGSRPLQLGRDGGRAAGPSAPAAPPPPWVSVQATGRGVGRWAVIPSRVEALGFRGLTCPLPVSGEVSLVPAPLPTLSHFFCLGRFGVIRGLLPVPSPTSSSIPLPTSVCLGPDPVLLPSPLQVLGPPLLSQLRLRGPIGAVSQAGRGR